MAPGRKRGAKGVKTKSELSLGDLVLAKVKGFPAWPAKISRPEDWKRAPDPKKYFVQFFGTSEIAFVAPADIQTFTNEAKIKLSVRCQGKTVKYFAQAVKEICEEFEELQKKKLSGIRDDNHTHTHPSEAHSIDPEVDEALDINCNNRKSESKLEPKVSGDLSSGLDPCWQKQNDVECHDVKPYLSDDVNHRLSLPVSSRKKNKLSPNHNNVVKDSQSVSSPTHHSLKKEDPLDIKVKGRYSDGIQNELTNGDRPKVAIGSKKKSQGAVLRNGGSVVPHDHSEEVMRRKMASGGSMKLSSPDNPKLSDVSSHKREQRLMKEQRHSETADVGQQDAKVNLEVHNEAISRKKFKAQHGHEKQGSQTNEISSPAKISKAADTGKDANLIRVITCKSDSRSPNVVDDRMASKELKRFTSAGKAEAHQPRRMPVINESESDHYSDEEDLPPIKRHRRELDTMHGSSLISENSFVTSVSHKSDLLLPGKVLTPVMQLPVKRRSVRLCDDEDDESPKTPIHGGTASKVSDKTRVSDSKKKSVTHGESNAPDPLVLKNSGLLEKGLKEQVQSGRVMNRLLLSAAQQGMEKRTRESSTTHVSPSPRQLDSEKLAKIEVKPVSVSPKRSAKSVGDGTLSGELESKQPNKAPNSESRKRTPAGDDMNATSAAHISPSPRKLDSEKLSPMEIKPIPVPPKRSPKSVSGGRLAGEMESKQPNKAPCSEPRKKTPAGDNKYATSSDRLNQSISERSKQPSSGEKKKTTPKSDSRRINDSGSVRERLDAGKDNKTSYAVDSKISDSVNSMKNLLAAAQARKRQAHLQNTYGNHLFSISDIDMPGWGRSPVPTALAFEASNPLQLDVLGSHPNSPGSNVHQILSNNQHENNELEEKRVSSGHQVTESSLSGGTEAAVARDAFEGMIETLSRTKESIARATRLAIDCAKYGLANEVVELLIQKLENEPNLHRRVDLFFLVDSITQCSHSQRGASYVSTVQAALPRLIGAAAPAGAGAQENRRQCRKVLRLWLERKILPETVLRRYMDDIGVINDDTLVSLRRPSRAERSIDDPIREMEGMVVDEYGSNAMFQLPGLLSARVFEEEEEDEDAPDTNLGMKVDDNNPSKHSPAKGRDPENYAVTPSDRRHCILEEVDGELEMEDVSGHQKDVRPLMTSGPVMLALSELNSDAILESSLNISPGWLPSPEGSPPLPPGSPPATPPLPTSPPPSPPPPPSSPPPPPPPTAHQHSFPQLLVGQPQPPLAPPPHVGPLIPVGPSVRPAGPSPPVGPPPQHLRPPPPPLGPHPPPFGPPPPIGPPAPLLSQQSFPPRPPLPSTLPLSPHSASQPPSLPHEVGVAPTGNEQALMVSSTHGSHMDAAVRGELLPQQSSCFPPPVVSNARKHVGYKSSRHVEYGEEAAYMNTQTSLHRQQYLPGSAPFSQRPVHPELPSQRPPNHFPYTNSSQQHQYPSYSLPNFSDGPRRYMPDEQWRMKGNEFNADHPHGGWMPGGRPCLGPSYSHEGYQERPPASAINYQHSAPSSLPSSGQMPVHGVPMMASRPNMSAVNWRPS